MAQIGFPTEPKTNFVINTGMVNIAPLVPYINSWDWLKIVQNAKFEAQFLDFFEHARMRNIFDTLIAERVANQAARTHSLEALADRYLGVKLDKSVRTSFFMSKNKDGFSDKQLRYAADDVEVLWGIMEAQQAKIEETGQQKVAELEFELTPVVGHMEMIGIPVNVAKWNKVLGDYRTLHEESRLKMQGLLYDDGNRDEQVGMFVRDGGINLGSPLQILKAFHDLGIQIKDTSDQTISRIDHPLAHELMNYRGLDKIMTSYGKSFTESVHPFTGRLHPNFQQVGADTGRFSCKEPNVQQIPPEFRACIGDVENYLVVGADYSQIELRIIAELSDDPFLVEAFQSGVDVHKQTAARMFRKPIEDVTDLDRFTAKTINFGLAYGMGVKKLRDTVNKESPKKKIDFKEAHNLIEKHKASYPVVAHWLEQTGITAFQEAYSETMYGRKRFYTRPDRKVLSEEDFQAQVASIQRKGSNTPIQGTNADITKLAMVAVHNDLMDYGMRADIINQVHDEIVLLVHKSQVEEAEKVITNAMIRAAESLIHRVPVKVDTYSNVIWKKK